MSYYKMGHIFKIICKLDSNIIYIGSTFEELRKRWYRHRVDYKGDKYKTYTIHKYFDKYDIKNFKMIHVKSYLCCRENNRDCRHLNMYETLWINKTKNCINKKLPFSPMNFINENMAKRIWREKNKDKKKQYDIKYKKEYNSIIITCACGSTMIKASYTSHLKTKKHLKNLQKKFLI